MPDIHMTGPEHFRHAEELLDVASSADYGSDSERYALKAAMVHAVLADAAATATLATSDLPRDLAAQWDIITLPQHGGGQS